MGRRGRSPAPAALRSRSGTADWSGLLNWFDPLISGLLLGLYGLVFGAAIGALVGLLVRELSSGRRDFLSTRSLKAGRYDVLADAEVAEDARTRLVA